MNSEWLKTRQTKFTAYATIYVLIVIAVLGLVNWLANRHNKSVDTTANKRFSLSDQTKKVVSNLQQDVKVTYFDKTSSFTQAKDLLDRYETLSPKLRVDYVDPDKKPQVAKSMGVKSYGPIMVDSGARHQEAKSLTEEEVTGAVIRTLKGGDRSVCVVSGSGEHSLDDTGRSGYSGIKEQIEKNNYKTRAISLLDKPEVPKDCTITLVAGPRFDYVEPVVNALKTYQQNGGRLLLLLDPPVKLGKEDVSENAALAKVIDSWGVTLNKDLVLDTSGVGQLFGFSEVVPLVTTYESHPIVREMKGIATAFPLTRSLDVKAGAEKLFSTSDNSFSTNKLDAKEIRIDPAKDKHGPFALGAAGSVKAGEGQARFVVVGSSGWVANSIVSFNGNKDLFLNMLNWLSADEELISIRPKDPEDRRISMNKLQMQMVFYSSVLLLPLIIIVTGFGVYWRRR
jgi:ABC-type uncharacterized transport system involved in gliding motility auxiliary subunit